MSPAAVADLVARGPGRGPRRRDDLPTSPTADEPRHTDVLGEVLAVDDDGVLVRTRRGDVRVPAADIVLTKLVPPPPVRRHRRAGDRLGRWCAGAGPQMVLFCGL